MKVKPEKQIKRVTGNKKVISSAWINADASSVVLLKSQVHFQLNLGLQQMQQLKFNFKVSKDPIATKIVLWKLLGSKMTLQT